MEIMDILEGKVESLIAEIASLHSEKNDAIDKYQEKIAELIAENTALQEELQKEQQIKSEILHRIDGLLLRLKERSEHE
ncbi:MAG: cell division protein ZapB [Desulfovibrionaceae bacterium]|nr:cell division protein ZapB [Desulfovibrionaceae bacterium]